MQTILLAAGLSRRMGTQKLLLPWQNATILEATITSLRHAGLSPIFCVLSPETARHLDSSLFKEGLSPVENPSPENGQASSLKIGLAVLGPGPFCLALGDLPYAQGSDIAALLRLFELRPQGFTGAVPYRAGRFGHPMFLEAPWKERLMSSEGDRGGKEALTRHQSELLLTPGSDGFFDDIDTPEDYWRYQTGLKTEPSVK